MILEDPGIVFNLKIFLEKKVLLRMVGSKESRICPFTLFLKLMLLSEYGVPHCVLTGCTAVLMEMEFKIENESSGK